MTVLAGHPSASQAYISSPASPTGIPVGAASAPRMADQSQIVIDGTPIRVVVLALAAAGGLWALRLGGFKFNVGVSS